MIVIVTDDKYKPVTMCGWQANTKLRTNVCLMLAHRVRRRANIKPTLVKSLVFAGYFVQTTLLYIRWEPLRGECL